jgi:hypothetical protein
VEISAEIFWETDHENDWAKHLPTAIELELSDERFDRGLVVAVIRPVGDGIAAAEEAS